MEHFLQGNSSINCTSLEIFSLLCGPLKAAGYYCLSSGSPYMLVEGLIGYSISKRSVTYNSGLIGWIFFLLPFFWSISPMKLALLEAMLYFLGDKRWPLATGQYCLKSVFPEIRVRTWFQVVSRQKNRPLIGWSIWSTHWKPVFLAGKLPTWTHVLTRISEKTDFSTKCLCWGLFTWDSNG